MTPTCACNLERFSEVLDFYRLRSLPTPLRHLANSGAVLQHPDTWFDLVRPGILLYGVSPTAALPLPPGVGPALTWKSRVVYFKVVEAGHPVSYGATWAPERWTRMVTLPVGLRGWVPARAVRQSTRAHWWTPLSHSGSRLHGPADGRHWPKRAPTTATKSYCSASKATPVSRRMN